MKIFTESKSVSVNTATHAHTESDTIQTWYSLKTMVFAGDNKLIQFFIVVNISS